MANPLEWLEDTQPVDPARINGVAPGALRIGADGDAVVTFQGAHAGYHSTLGVYLIGEDGAFTDGRILLTDSSMEGRSQPGKLSGIDLPAVGESLHLSALYSDMDLAPGQGFGLFLIAGGTTRNKLERIERGDEVALLDKRTGEPADATTPSWRLKLETVDEGKALHGKVYLTSDSSPDDPAANGLNRDGAEHVLSATDEETGDLWLGFEDRTDNDFDDLVISIHTETDSGLPFPRVQIVELGEGRLTVFEGSPGDRLGGAVDGLGDLDGDGIADLIIGADTAGEDALAGTGVAYAIMGQDGGFRPIEPVADLLMGGQAQMLESASTLGRFGWSVAGAGDFDGDGMVDIIAGGPRGGANGEGTVELFLSSSGRLTIDGLVAGDDFGVSVDGVGDINNDGFADIIIGARLADQLEVVPNGGEAYVVFGNMTGTIPDLAALDGTNGFRVLGTDPIDQLGRSVAGLGDINGDGIADLGVGVPDADPLGRENAGEAFVVFGGESGFAPTIGGADLDGTTGFRIVGAKPGDFAGFEIDSAGDINGDGIGDIIVGSFEGTPGDMPRTGSAYVVFGSDQGFDPVIDLGMLDGSDGFAIPGLMTDDAMGRAVTGVGDVNGDGFGDIVVGAEYADPLGVESAGEAYLLFGHDGAFDAEIDLGALEPGDGLILEGPSTDGFVGWSVAGAGDVDNDGYDDMLIGAPGDFAQGITGLTYLVYGGEHLNPEMPVA